MALSPQAMMMLRRGPAMGPSPVPGGSAPSGAPPGAAPTPPPVAGMPDTPGSADPSNILQTAIAEKIKNQKTADTSFLVKTIEQQMRVIGTLMVHLMQTHPEVSRHLNRMWSSGDAAKKALADSIEKQAVPMGPPLGFSGASGPFDQSSGGPPPGM